LLLPTVLLQNVIQTIILMSLKPLQAPSATRQRVLGQVRLLEKRVKITLRHDISKQLSCNTWKKQLIGL